MKFKFLKKGNQFNKEKIFVIGLHKTGTTSLGYCFKELGYQVGDQRKGEKLLEDWSVRKFDRIIEFVHSADVFQDTPFALPQIRIPNSLLPDSIDSAKGCTWSG